MFDIVKLLCIWKSVLHIPKPQNNKNTLENNSWVHINLLQIIKKNTFQTNKFESPGVASLIKWLSYTLPLKDGVGPVDIRHTTDSLYHIITTKTKFKKCDMWYVKRDTWHVTCDMWWKLNIFSKFVVPSSYGLGTKAIWRFKGKGYHNQWINEIINE